MRRTIIEVSEINEQTNNEEIVLKLFWETF